MTRKEITVEKREIIDALFWLNKALDNTYKTEDEVDNYINYAIICLQRALST